MSPEQEATSGSCGCLLTVTGDRQMKAGDGQTERGRGLNSTVEGLFFFSLSFVLKKKKKERKIPDLPRLGKMA